MAKTLQQYADWLDVRDDLWPVPPKPVPVKATPSLKPLRGIRAVVWSVYGTLLRISDGRLLFEHPQSLRMQVALEKTIHEFNMWQSMSRKPGAPWEYMLQQYRQVLEEQQMAGTRHKGDFPAVDSAALWRKLLGRLEQKEYRYDEALYGDMDELAEKVAYYFHARLQGVEAAPDAADVLMAVASVGLRQGLLDDGQSFTLVQLLRALRRQATLPAVGDLFDPGSVVLSYRAGVRKPSPSLYRACLKHFEESGVGADEILYVASRVRDDLAAARQAGMRTALYAGDKISLEATQEELRDPALRPDRLLTDLAQIREVLEIDRSDHAPSSLV